MGKFKPVLRAIEHPRRQGQRLARSLVRTTLGAPEEALPRDVWRWTSRKHRIRTVILLFINAALFAGLGFFLFWLRTGANSPFSQTSYWDGLWQVFNPADDQQITLVDYLVRPIPVAQVPIMMVILGLALAAMTAVPILVSMLYRFPFSLIFTAIIGFVALFPWMAITITFCCFLARWRPLRFNFRFATALLSLLPVGVYYALATRNATVAEHLAPVEMAKLYLPWVFALLAACVVMGVVLGIARLVNDRPGAIAPLMAVLFVAPVVLFEVRVGRDELYYRLIEQQFGPASTSYFVDRVDASDVIQRIALKRMEGVKDRNVTLAAMEQQVRTLLQLQFGAIRQDWEEEAGNALAGYAQQQYEASRACKRFLEQYPKSRYCPNVLYIEGRAQDIRLDRDLFWRKGIVQYYDDFPSMASRRTWERLVRDYGQSPLASVAMYRLGQLRARAGDVDGAVAILKQLIQQYGQTDAQSTQPESPASVWQLLTRAPTSSLLQVKPGDVALQGRKLLVLIEYNRDPQQKDLALRTLLSFDPYDPGYLRNLRHLLRDIETRYPLTGLRDNIEVQLAAADPSPSLKIKALEDCVHRLARDPASDAYPQAQYELGLAYQADNRVVEARAVFEEMRSKQTASLWEIEARRQLAQLGASTNERSR
jgi:outer membrane protein assembly factor BamD (BamD/ComL family)